MEKNARAHKESEKGRKWTSRSGNVINASLDQLGKIEVILLRKKDKKPVKLKISDLSDSDQKFLKQLVWDGEKVGSLSLQSLGEEDQKLICIANAVIRERSRRGREIKVSQPFASLRVKAGISFTQFIHGHIDLANPEIDDDVDIFSITDRINGSEAMGFYVKVEGVTDDKRSKSYLQFSSSGSGFKSLGFGLEHNVWKSVNLGLDCVLYPRGSGIEFRSLKTDADKTWTWYPGGEGGVLLFAPYMAIQF